jgi:hypothetical protein
MISSSRAIVESRTTYIPRDAIPLLAEVANRPIVSDTVLHIGYGSTGGIVIVPEPIAQDVVRRALRILDGESPSREPIADGEAARAYCDPTPTILEEEQEQQGIETRSARDFSLLLDTLSFKEF